MNDRLNLEECGILIDRLRPNVLCVATYYDLRGLPGLLHANRLMAEAFVNYAKTMRQYREAVEYTRSLQAK